MVDPCVHYQALSLHLARLWHLRPLFLPSKLHQLSVQQLLLDVCETPPAASTCQLSFPPLSSLGLPPSSATYLASSSIQIGTSLWVHGAAKPSTCAARNGMRISRCSVSNAFRLTRRLTSQGSRKELHQPKEGSPPCDARSTRERRTEAGGHVCQGREERLASEEEVTIPRVHSKVRRRKCTLHGG